MGEASTTRGKKTSGFTSNGNPIELGVQVTDVAKTMFSVKKMKDAGNIIIFGADEGDMIVNKSTGTRTPIIDTGREFVLDIYVPGGVMSESGKNDTNYPIESGKCECKGAKTERVAYGCKATEGGFWNSLVKEDDDIECKVCCPATFRRHP